MNADVCTIKLIKQTKQTAGLIDIITKCHKPPVHVYVFFSDILKASIIKNQIKTREGDHWIHDCQVFKEKNTNNSKRCFGLFYCKYDKKETILFYSYWSIYWHELIFKHFKRHLWHSGLFKLQQMHETAGGDWI